jgi:hypothetical protein
MVAVAELLAALKIGAAASMDSRHGSKLGNTKKD